MPRHFQSFSQKYKDCPNRTGTQPTKPVKVCGSVSPKMGSNWPHFRVDIPFFDSEVGPLHRGLETYMNVVRVMKSWGGVLRLPPHPRTSVASLGGAIWAP